MTSTPPAWRWLDECEVPVQAYQWMTSKTPGEAELSIGTPKTPDSDVLRIQNDNPDPTYQDCWPSERYKSDEPDSEPEMSSSTTRKLDTGQCPDCRCAPNTPHATGCGWPAHLTDSAINAVESHTCCECYQDFPDGQDGSTQTGSFRGPVFYRCPQCAMAADAKSDAAHEHPAVTEPEATLPADSCVVARCPVCRHEMESDEGVLCDHCEEPTGVESFAVVNGTGGVFLYHLACYDEVYWGADDDDVQVMDRVVESCPECGTVTDIEYVDEGFSVPFAVQSFMFEELADAQLEYLHDILNKQSGRIIEMARDRFRDGYKLYGSKMFAYTPDERRHEVLCELADAACYLVSGPVE